MIQTSIKAENTQIMSGDCPECGGSLSRQQIETVCSLCGLVVGEDPLDRGPDWRNLDDPHRNTKRVGAPLTPTRHDRGLSTEIGYGNGRSSQLSGRNRRRFARLRKQHNRAQVRSKIERNRIYAFSEIRRLTAALSLPESIRERSCVLFQSAQNEDLLRGRSIEGFAAASVYANCRLDNLARTREEILAVARAADNELRTAYDALNRELGLPLGPIDPAEYVPRFATNLSLPDSIERRARELVLEAHDAGIVAGRNPCGVAAACLYTAAQEANYPLTQQDAADVADVAAVTIRSTYHDLR